MNGCSRSSRFLVGAVVALTVWLPSCLPIRAQANSQFSQTYLVALQGPVTLDVDIERGQLQILYSRDGQVSISASMQASVGPKVSQDSFHPPLVEHNGNHFVVRVPGAVGDHKANIYRLEVPYRTEVVARVGNGKQEISGIMGPVKAVTESGDIRISYVSQDIAATVGTGNLDLRVIGGRVQSRVRRGNISCTRAPQGIAAETEDGDINLMAVGPSTAKVEEGSGRIEVSGARASLVASTDRGDIYVRAMVHDDWQVRSRSGNVRIELPPNARFLFDASTEEGELLLDRDDLERANAGARRVHQAVNSGGKRIDAHTETGQIAIR